MKLAGERVSTAIPQLVLQGGRANEVQVTVKYGVEDDRRQCYTPEEPE